jgi:hypothetical protein
VKIRHDLSKMAAGAFIRSLLGGLVLFGVLLACCRIAPGLAAADPMPLWSDPITTSAWAAYGVGGREALYVNELQTGMLDTERVIGPDGAIEYQAETGNTTIVPPALAVDGSGYVLRVGGVAGVIDAIDTTGKVRWSYTVPAEDTVRALLAGDDGAAYVVVSNAIDDEVLRLSTVDGSVTFDTPLPDGTYSDGYLFAEPTGVATITGTHIIFLSQQGQVTADVPAISSGSAAAWFTSNDAGDVFVGSAPVGNGQVDTASGIAVSEVNPSGQLDWTTQTPANDGGGESTGLAALPDGGVAYEVAGQSVGVLNPDGTTRWSTKSQHGYGPMLADSADHIDFETFIGNQNCSDAVANCDGFGVDQLEASDGQVQHSLSLVYTDNDPSQFFFCGGLSLGSGLFYVVDRLSFGDGESCSDGLTQPQLQAFALPGTTGPYPSPPTTTIPTTTQVPSGGGSGSMPPGNGSTPSPAPIYPCTPIHASIAKMLLKSLRCSLLNALSFVACGYGVAQYLVLPLDAAKTARGLYDLRKVGKEFRPFAKAANDILKAKFRKGAIPGFRTGAQIIKKLKQARTATKVIELLPDIAKSISTKDLENFINDLVKIAGLKPCVDGIVNGIES